MVIEHFLCPRPCARDLVGYTRGQIKLLPTKCTSSTCVNVVIIVSLRNIMVEMKLKEKSHRKMRKGEDPFYWGI